MKLRPIAALLFVVLSLPVGARAREPAAAPLPGKLVWRDEWPRFSGWEGAATVAATVGVYIAERRVPDPSEARLRFEVPVLDPGVRYLLRARTVNVDEAFSKYSDVGFRMMAFFPYVMDAGVAALGIHRSPDVAAQLALIDIQALTLSGATQLFASRLIGRERPYVQDCVVEGDGKSRTLSRECGTGNDFKSFFSGHAAGVFASAGLVCVEHQHLPLYGGGPVEAWACAWALGVATATGVARIINDAHYASDVIAGAGIGWFYGYVMPRLMHFWSGRLQAPARRSVFTWAPSFGSTGDGGVLSVLGTF